MAEDPLQSEALISLVEAAEYSGLTHDFLRQLASKGKLRARKFGRNWLTTREAVDEYLQEGGKLLWRPTPPKNS